MILAPSRGFAFVHIHKCAGTSISHLLTPHLSWQDVALGVSPAGLHLDRAWRLRFDLHKHSPAHHLRNVVGEDTWNQLFVFSAIRNPYTRFRSLYTFATRYLRNERRRDRLRRWSHSLTGHPAPDSWWSYPLVRAARRAGSFSAFLRHPLTYEDYATKPQTFWVLDPLTRAPLTDDLVAVESLQTDLDRILPRLGIPHQPTPHKNPSRHPDPPALDPADAALIAERYADDFALLGYDPDPKRLLDPPTSRNTRA